MAVASSGFPLEALARSGIFPASVREELGALRAERDPGFLAESLCHLAGRLEREGHLEAATELYRVLADTSSRDGDVGRPLRDRAAARMNALLGRGPWQGRLETLGRRFVAQATDPAMIFAFGVGGGVAHLVRAGGMASLALRAPGLLSRGFGARLLAGTAAYAVEVPAFVAAHRAALGLLNPQVPEAGWGEELAGAAVFLGVLKCGGGLAGELTRGRAWSAYGRGGVVLATQLGGIYAAHGVQESLGLRPRQDAANRAVDALDAFLQMQVGGRFLHGLRPFSAPGLGAILESGTQAAPLPRRLLLRSPRAGEGFADRLAASRRGEAPPPEASAASPEREAAARARILERFGRERGVGIVHSLESLARLFETPLSRVLEVGSPWLEGEGERLHLGLRRLRHAAEYSSTHVEKGSYLNWLLRLSLQETLRRGRSDWGERLLGHLERGAPLETVESLVAEQVPEFDLFGVRSGRTSAARDVAPPASVERAIRRLPLGGAAQEVLGRFARYQGDIPAEFLRALDSSLRSGSPVSRLLEPILLGARESPASYLRLIRLFHVLVHDPAIHAKLFELHDPLARLWGERDREGRGFVMLRSQEDGYLGEARWVEYLSAMLEESAALRDPLEAMRRRERTEAVLRGVFPEAREISPDDLTRALEALGDPMSARVASALRAGEAEIRLLPDAEFEDCFARENNGNSGAMVHAFLIPAGEGGPRSRLVMRQIQRVSDFAFRRALRERLVMAVHEFDHHLHPPESPRSDLSALREELPAHLRHIHYRALLGYPEELDAMFQESPAGPALYLRDKIEAIYFMRYAGRPGRSAAMAGEAGLPPSRWEGLREQSDYIRGLLNLAARSLDAAAREAGPPPSPHFLEWLEEADWALRQYLRDLQAARASLGTGDREPFAVLDADYTRWRRASQHLRTAYLLQRGGPTVRGAEEIRRRRDWLASLEAFDVAAPGAEAGGSLSSGSRVATGLELLRRFHPDFSEEQAGLYERAARGPIQNRDIAFDLDKTLGDTLMRYLAEDAFRQNPESFDVRMEDFIHQYTRMRLPYRGVQAMLLGLWAAGNRVRLYTASENLVGNHEVFFNDFPLIKVAMEIVPPTDPHRLVSRADLHAAPHYMDRLKFRELYARHFGHEAGQGFLAEVAREQELRRLPDLTVAKLPFPEFPFDVLVDDLYYFAGDLMTVGLGRRWVLAEGDVPRMLSGLEEYFSRPLPETSPLWRRWLERGSEEP